jgi:drug/metabolite transporter (DMT)-like permease
MRRSPDGCRSPPSGRLERVSGDVQATSTALPVLGGLVAALLFAVANNVQRHAAKSVPHGHVGPVGLLLRLLRNPRWLIGSGCAVLGLLVQTWALSRGGVILVQAVVASTLVFSLALESVVERRWPAPSQLAGAVLVAVGISLLVLVGKPGAGGAFHSLGRIAIVFAVLAAVGGGALLTSHRRPKGRRTAIVMGAAAGACFALDAVFLRGLTVALSPLDAVGLVISVAGFAVASLLGNLVIQRGFQMAPLRHVLPAMAAAEPVTAFLCGRYVFGEHLQTGVTGALGVGGGLVLMVCGVVLTAFGPVRPAAAPEPAEPTAESTAVPAPAAPTSTPAREPAAARSERRRVPAVGRRRGATRYEPPLPALPYMPPFDRADKRPDHIFDGGHASRKRGERPAGVPASGGEET